MLLGTYEDERIVFDRWQIADLHDYSRIRAREKGPQIGASWLRACEAVWEAMLFEDAMTAFVSIDQREASEKVLYARKLYDGLPEIIRRQIPLVKDAVEELGWGESGRPARVLSLPNTSALRGRKMNVVLDEADFYRDGGREAYRAGMGRIARGGRLSIQSTCFGSGTLLDNLMQGIDDAGDQDARADPVSRARFPWTVVENEDVVSSIDIARQTLDETDFLEEYECVRGASGADPFSADLLRKSQHEEDGFRTDKSVILVEDKDQQLVGGYDVGKGSGRHPSVISLFSRDADNVWRQRALLQPMRGMRPLTLPEQHEYLREMMLRLPNLILVPDAQGIGAHISQALEREFGYRCIPMIPGSKPPSRPVQTREEMATEIKRALEQNELQLMPDREQIKQFRQTRRNDDGKLQQGGSKAKTHYDRFWATTYAAYGIQALGRVRSPYADHGLRVIEMRPRRGVA